MMQCWAQKTDDRPTFVALREFLVETMPTDMRALQDFDEPDKLEIQMNDVITIIEGRCVPLESDNAQQHFKSVLVRFLPILLYTFSFSHTGQRTTGGEVRTSAP